LNLHITHSISIIKIEANQEPPTNTPTLNKNYKPMDYHFTLKELKKLETEAVVQHCVCLQVREKQYKKELIKVNKNLEKLTERLMKKEAKKPKKPKNPKKEVFQGKIPRIIHKITELSWRIHKNFPFGGKEHHYQASLEMELRELGYMVSREVTCLFHYTSKSGKTIQLPHDIRGREDLVLPEEKLILELKQIRTMDNKEHKQLMRYMKERNEHSIRSTWGQKTQGMLINFGDEDLEIWWMFYPSDSPTSESITRVCIFKENLPSLSTNHLICHLPPPPSNIILQTNESIE
jgi:GxxExxY protein